MHNTFDTEFYRPSGFIFFSYLTDFSYFSVNFFLRKLQDTIRTDQIWPFWRGCRCFQLFSLIFRYFIFYQNHPWFYIHDDLVGLLLIGQWKKKKDHLHDPYCMSLDVSISYNLKKKQIFDFNYISLLWNITNCVL